MMRKAVIVLIAGLWSLVTVGCGGGGGSTSSSTTTPPSSSTSRMMTTVGDAPLDSVLAANVTISAVTVNTATGSVSLLSKAHTVELSSLGAVRAPLELSDVPAGTYTGASVTVTAANITYVDPSTQKVVTKSATISNGTASVTFASPLTVAAGQAESDLRLDFDLSKSIDLTGSTLTFTPVVKAAVAQVDKESDSEREVHVSGTITAVSGNTVTVQTADGSTVTLTLGNSTHFEDSMSASSLQAGAMIDVEGKLQDDGTILVTDFNAADQGEAEDSHSMGGAGIVTATTTDSNGTLTSFQMVMRRAFVNDDVGKAVTVQVSSSTVFRLTWRARNAGVQTFDATQIFPGQAVFVAGALNTDGSIAARQVMSAPESPSVTLAVPPQSGQTSFTVQLNSQGMLASLAKISTLDVNINGSTVVEGTQITVSGLANLAVGTPLTIRGYLAESNGSYVFYASRIRADSGQ